MDQPSHGTTLQLTTECRVGYHRGAGSRPYFDCQKVCDRVNKFITRLVLTHRSSIRCVQVPLKTLEPKLAVLLPPSFAIAHHRPPCSLFLLCSLSAPRSLSPSLSPSTSFPTACSPLISTPSPVHHTNARLPKPGPGSSSTVRSLGSKVTFLLEVRMLTCPAEPGLYDYPRSSHIAHPSSRLRTSSPTVTTGSNGHKYEKGEPYLRVRITGLDRNRRDVLVKFDAQVRISAYSTSISRLPGIIYAHTPPTIDQSVKLYRHYLPQRFPLLLRVPTILRRHHPQYTTNHHPCPPSRTNLCSNRRRR